MTIRPMILENQKIKYSFSRIGDTYICLSAIVILFCVACFSWNVDCFSIDKYIWIYNWIGVGILLFGFISWRNLEGKIFTPYTIFFLIMLIFNYGQFLLWAFGIHYKGEMGTTDFIRYMDKLTLLRIQLVASVGFVSFHFGALFAANRIRNRKYKEKNNINCDLTFSSLKYVCYIISPVSAAVAFFICIKNLHIAQIVGYSAIYYGSDTYINPLLKYISFMFFPSLLGIWIGNKFSKRSFFFVCLVFGVYMIMDLLAGDRDSWFYNVLILLWCYFNYINKPNVRNILTLSVLGGSLISATSVLVKFRDIGITRISNSDVMDVIHNAGFMFLKPFFEMGQSARVLGILIQDQLDRNWHYGNTYIASILAIFLPRIKTYFGFYDFYIENWISQMYLHLTNYGIGFSITAEAYLNGGLYFMPVIMAILGLFMGSLLYLPKRDKNDPLKIYLVLGSLASLIFIDRGTIELPLRVWFFGTVVVLGVTVLVKNSMIKNTKSVISKKMA